MEKILLFPLLLAAGCIISGLYGAFHNQISYTVSPDYFHAFKFDQFGIPEPREGDDEPAMGLDHVPDWEW